jgi:hypothetical protein
MAGLFENKAANSTFLRTDKTVCGEQNFANEEACALLSNAV